LSLNPNAIHLLEKNPSKINWNNLFRNRGAIHLLEKNPSKIDWYYLSANPSIFEFDFAMTKTKIEERCNIYKYELLEIVLQPDNYNKFNDWGL